MYSATDDASGIATPSSRMPSRCIRMASRIRSSTSVCVEPVATQPGRSGENADKLLGVFSMTIKYLVCIDLVLESSLPQDAVERSGRKVILRMTGNRHPPRFCGVFVLAVTALLSDHHPTVILNYTLNFTNSHESPHLRSPNGLCGRRRLSTKRNTLANQKIIQPEPTLIEEGRRLRHGCRNSAATHCCATGPLIWRGTSLDRPPRIQP
jgi:hypothetical protein